MPTTVHIPTPLLKEADQRAKALGISRNRLIVQALKNELRERQGWLPGFFEQLANVDDETVQAVEEMMTVIRKNRRSKPPIQF
jgi:metal-responsive CopG/Arc/MetJ family transcriptional regulator